MMQKSYRISSTLSTPLVTVGLDEELKAKGFDECPIWALNYFVDENDRPVKDKYFVGRQCSGLFSNNSTTNSALAAFITASRDEGTDYVSVTLSDYGRHLVKNFGTKDWIYDITVTEETGDVIKGTMTLPVENFTMLCASPVVATKIIGALKTNKRVVVALGLRDRQDSYSFEVNCNGFASIFDDVANMAGKSAG